MIYDSLQFMDACMSALAATRKKDKAWKNLERKRERGEKEKKQAGREREGGACAHRTKDKMEVSWPMFMSFLTCYFTIFYPCAEFQGLSIITMQTPEKDFCIRCAWPSGRCTKDMANSRLIVNEGRTQTGTRHKSRFAVGVLTLFP